MCNLFQKTRKATLILMTISFVALVTGLTLKLHLYNHKNQDNHNSRRCSICQQLLLTPNQFTLEQQSSLLNTDLLKNIIDFPLQSPVITFHHEPFGPRPPPCCLAS